MELEFSGLQMQVRPKHWLEISAEKSRNHRQRLESIQNALFRERVGPLQTSNLRDAELPDSGSLSRLHDGADEGEDKRKAVSSCEEVSDHAIVLQRDRRLSDLQLHLQRSELEAGARCDQSTPEPGP